MNTVKRGKDVIIFATKENHQTPSTIKLPQPEIPEGAIRADGSINWSCPCLGGVATGPCGIEFREAFGCFQYSKAEPRGSDCMETFSAMQQCMSLYPILYGDDSNRTSNASKLDEKTKPSDSIDNISKTEKA